MKHLIVLFAVILVGCAGTQTTVTDRTVITEKHVFRTPPVQVEIPAAATADSISIVADTPEARVIVTPETITPEVKKAVATIRKAKVTVTVQPPPVELDDQDTVATVVSITKERSVWEKILDVIPIIIGAAVITSIIILVVRIMR